MSFVVKYFFEEPASLEVLTPDDDADARRQGSAGVSLDDLLNQSTYYRGYLTATDLAERTFGLTQLPATDVGDVLRAILGTEGIRAWDSDGEVIPFQTDNIPARLKDLIAIIAGEEVDDRAAIAEGIGRDRRRSLPALRSLLDAGATVLLPEPAHDGTDISVFAGTPLRSRVEAALRRRVRPGVRAFSIPHRDARSEEKFYFELYDVERFARWEIKHE